jgi:hypothetical protein
MRKRLVLLRALVLCGIGLAAVAPSGATVLPRFDAGDLADHSALIFVGTVVDQQVEVTGDGVYPYTFVTFQVEKVLKGETDKRLTLRFDGGDTGRGGIKVVGMPEFEVGGRHLLFVAGPGEAFCPLAGWGQGKLDFVRHPRSGREVLVDQEGRLVAGLKGENFRRQAGKLGDKPAAKKVEVLAEENVKVTFPEEETVAAPTEEPAAEQVVAQLASWLRARPKKAGAMAPGRIVSASPYDLPEHAPMTKGGAR